MEIVSLVCLASALLQLVTSSLASSLCAGGGLLGRLKEGSLMEMCALLREENLRSAAVNASDCRLSGLCSEAGPGASRDSWLRPWLSSSRGGFSGETGDSCLSSCWGCWGSCVVL